MQHHRSAARLAILATASAILLAGCGGSDSDDGDNKDKKIEGADSPSMSPSQSSSADAGRPKITLPKGTKNVFEGQETGDAKKDAVLADNAEWVNATDDAIFRGKTFTQSLKFYSTGPALAATEKYVKGWVDAGDTWVGQTRYFNRKASFRQDGAASVIYCADESKAYIKDKKGKVDRSPATDDVYVLYNTRLEKTKSGVWQTVNVISKRGAPQCQP